MLQVGWCVSTHNLSTVISPNAGIHLLFALRTNLYHPPLEVILIRNASLLPNAV